MAHKQIQPTQEEEEPQFVPEIVTKARRQKWSLHSTTKLSTAINSMRTQQKTTQKLLTIACLSLFHSIKVDAQKTIKTQT